MTALEVTKNRIELSE